MKTEEWKCYCFKASEKKLLDKTVELMIPYMINFNLADRFGISLPDENSKSYCTDVWFLNPNETFKKELTKYGIKLSPCLPKDNQGNSVLNP